MQSLWLFSRTDCFAFDDYCIVGDLLHKSGRRREGVAIAAAMTMQGVSVRRNGRVAFSVYGSLDDLMHVRARGSISAAHSYETDLSASRSIRSGDSRGPLDL